MRRRKLITAGVTVALAGCLRSNEPPASEDLIEEAIETRVQMDDLEATRVATIETPTETIERTEHVMTRPPARNRREVLESTDSGAPEGTISVQNPLLTWEYDPETEEVLERHHPNRLVDDRMRLVLESVLEKYDLAYGGTETVDGRETHVVEAKAGSDVDVGLSISLAVGETQYVIPLESPPDDVDELELTRTLWIDDGYRHPVKEQTVVTDGDDTYSVSFAYEDLEIDTGLDDDVFTFDPPDDAEIKRRGTEPEDVFDSIEDAASAVPYDLPDPDVPEAYDLARVTVLEREWGVTTTLWYADPERNGRELFVVVKEAKRFDKDALERVEFDGQTGYVRDGRIHSIFWSCNGLHYEVSDPRGEEPIVEIATSIGCPRDVTE